MIWKLEKIYRKMYLPYSWTTTLPPINYENCVEYDDRAKYLPSMMPFNIQTNGQKYDGATSDSTQRESKPPIENPRKSSNGYFICTVGNVKSTIFASLIVFSFDNIAWWISKRLRFLINNITICQDETV